MFRKRALAAVLLGLALLIGLTATPTVLSGDGPPALPDLVPMGLNFNVSVTNRLGGPTLEFPILTANIGGQHFTRPRDPDTQQYLVRQVYQYDLYWYDPDVGDYTGPIDSRRKNTICMIDDGNRGRRVFQCIADRLNPFYTCGGTNGVSRGWADDYFRGLQGQWSFIGDYTGSFMLIATLDPDNDLQRTDIPDSGRDGNPDNNYSMLFFDWDGSTLANVDNVLSFDPGAVCP
jgi:hypothetical protein